MLIASVRSVVRSRFSAAFQPQLQFAAAFQPRHAFQTQFAAFQPRRFCRSRLPVPRLCFYRPSGQIFPTIVSKAKIIEVLSVGIGGDNYSGSLILMHSNIEILTPLILSREYYFIRYCQLVENGFWFITDVSVNLPGYSVKNRRLPSGCLIQEVPNGYSKVTWVENVEVEETRQTLGVFQNFVHSGTGMAFGAQCWLATLQRMTERFHYMLMPGPQNMDYGGVGYFVNWKYTAAYQKHLFWLKRWKFRFNFT